MRPPAFAINSSLLWSRAEAATRSRREIAFSMDSIRRSCRRFLICTQVGQEGIDLHRHCRHVVHYDLAWNPAVLEQRTGRADRIGSKTFRERDAASDPKSSLPLNRSPFHSWHLRRTNVTKNSGFEPRRLKF